MDLFLQMLLGIIIPESLDPWSVVNSLKTENYPAELATETIDMDYQNICCIVERGNASYCWRKS